MNTSTLLMIGTGIIIMMFVGYIVINDIDEKKILCNNTNSTISYSKFLYNTTLDCQFFNNLTNVQVMT